MYSREWLAKLRRKGRRKAEKRAAAQVPKKLKGKTGKTVRKKIESSPAAA